MKKKLLVVIGFVFVAVGLVYGVVVVNTTNDQNAAEQKFIEEMIPHHEGAIQMASQADVEAISPEVKALAASIIAAQQQEINDMRKWYKQWFGKEVPIRPIDPHAGHGGESQDTASTFDAAFLSMMIPHHEAAVKMAQDVLPKARHKEIKSLAVAIIRSQNEEIEKMKDYQKRLLGDVKATGSVTVLYTETGFDKANITVKAGTEVSFINKRRTQPMWVASDIHDTHELYPEFEQANAVGDAPSLLDTLYTFKFNKSGKWPYHDHNDPSLKGVVTVI